MLKSEKSEASEKAENVFITGNFKNVPVDSLSEGVETFLYNLYPPRVIKRFQYKPVAGKWFPFIDVKIQNRPNQWAFFYGRVNLTITEEKFCTACGINLKDETPVPSHIPISLCLSCRKKIYYGYWDCLYGVISENLRALEINFKSENQKPMNMGTQKSLCRNLLEPRCGYPQDAEATNPCLKNHGIGLILKDAQTLSIVIGPLNLLKYRLIWEGGLLALVFGFSNRILNLEQLNILLRKAFRTIYQSAESQLQILSPFSRLNHQQYQDFFNTELLIEFFKYYQDSDIRKHLNDYFSAPLKILEAISRSLVKDCDVEILDYVELCNQFPPLSRTFREAMEHRLNDHYNIEDKDYKWENFPDEIINHIPKFLEEPSQSPFNVVPLDLNNLKQEMSIHEVLGSFGPHLLCKSDYSMDLKDPILLNMKDLIGRKVY